MLVFFLGVKLVGRHGQRMGELTRTSLSTRPFKLFVYAVCREPSIPARIGKEAIDQSLRTRRVGSRWSDTAVFRERGREDVRRSLELISSFATFLTCDADQLLVMLARCT